MEKFLFTMDRRHRFNMIITRVRQEANSGELIKKHSTKLTTNHRPPCRNTKVEIVSHQDEHTFFRPLTHNFQFDNLHHQLIHKIQKIDKAAGLVVNLTIHFRRCLDNIQSQMKQKDFSFHEIQYKLDFQSTYSSSVPIGLQFPNIKSENIQR